MRFASESSRLQHPLAGRIAKYIWEKFCADETLTEEKLQLYMEESPLQTFLNIPSPLALLTYKEKTTAWICIAIAHPEGEADKLIKLAKLLNFTADKTLALSSLLGNIPIIKAILNDEDKNIIIKKIKANNYEVFINAIASGKITVIEYLFRYTTLEIVIEECKLSLFEEAAKNGHLHIIEYFIKILAKNENDLKKLLELASEDDKLGYYFYSAFIKAAEYDHLHIIKYFIENLGQLSPDSIVNIFSVNDCAAFVEAAKNGHLGILKYFLEELPRTNEAFSNTFNKKINTSVKVNECVAFNEAIANGHLNILKYFLEELPHTNEAFSKALNEKIHNDIKTNSFTGHILAAGNGHLETIKYLIEHFIKQAPHLVKELVVKDRFAIMQAAATQGYTEIIKYLIEDLIKQHPAFLEEMEDEEAFFQDEDNEIKEDISFDEEASSQEDIVEEAYFDEEINDKASYQEDIDEATFLHAEAGEHPSFKRRIHEALIDTFHQATSCGHLDLTDYLIKSLPSSFVLHMLKANKYFAFSQAAKNRHANIIKFLINYIINQNDLLPVGILEAILTIAFKKAAKNKLIEVLNYLEEVAPAFTAQQTELYNIQAFKKTAETGDKTLLKDLVRQIYANDEKKVNKIFKMASPTISNRIRDNKNEIKQTRPPLVIKMVQADNFYGFRKAAENGHLEIIKAIEKIAPDLIEAMLKAESYDAFNKAAYYKHTNVINHLLTHPSCFAWADLNSKKYGINYLYPFINDKITELEYRRHTLSDTNPDEIFDINEAEAKLCLYIIRNLISRNDINLSPKIMFLLDIPAIKNLTHSPITHNQPNELLNLARLNHHYDEIIKKLLNIEKVRAIAKPNNTHANGQSDDLPAIPQADESSLQLRPENKVQPLAVYSSSYQPEHTQSSTNFPTINQPIKNSEAAIASKNTSAKLETTNDIAKNNINSTPAASRVYAHYPFAIAHREHFFKCFEAKYDNKSGDAAKAAILTSLEEELDNISTAKELKTFKKSIKRDERYNILQQGQGLMTRLLKFFHVIHIKTSSELALNKMIKERRTQLS